MISEHTTVKVTCNRCKFSKTICETSDYWKELENEGWWGGLCPDCVASAPKVYCVFNDDHRARPYELAKIFATEELAREYCRQEEDVTFRCWYVRDY